MALAVARPHDGTVARPHGGTVAQPHDGTVARVHGGTAAQVHNGTVARQRNGSAWTACPRNDTVQHSMNQTSPLGLAAHEATVRREFDMLNLPARCWLPPQPQGALDVLVVGAGMNGIAAAGALIMRGIRNIAVLNDSQPGREGPWMTYAKMEMLRSPKTLPGPCFGIPSLTYRAYHEARFGTADWQALYKILNQHWQDYLGWLQRVLELPVRHGVKLARLVPAHGLLRAELEGGGAILARRVVLATGRGGAGGLYWPAFIAPELRPDLAVHTNEMIDFVALRGKRVAVIGAGPSALDNAAAAMEHGAAGVDVYVRRKILPQINKGRGSAHPGFHRAWGELDDPDRWAFLVYGQDLQAPPPHETVFRVLRLGVRIHLGQPVAAATRDGAEVLMRMADGCEYRHDFLIAGTGFRVDLGEVPELVAFAPHIARWGDRYTPPPHLMREDLAAFPYLGSGFELQPRGPGAPAELGLIHLMNYGAHATFGGIASDIPGVAIAGDRLADAITRHAFRENFPAIRAAVEAFDEPELEGTPFFVPRS